MAFDGLTVVGRLEKRSPALARRLLGVVLGRTSPFNRQLHMTFTHWDQELCRGEVRSRRGLHNHLRGVHAGALVTVGESVAGLLAVRNFPIQEYRLILKALSASYERQAKGALVAEACLDPAQRERVRVGLASGEAQLLELESVLSEPGGERLAVVKTTWQLKPWSKVRTQV